MSLHESNVAVATADGAGTFGALCSSKVGNSSNNKPRGITFADLYYSSGQVLGSGAYARVECFRSVADSKEYAVKIVEAFGNERCRQKVFKEIEIYSLCSGHPHIIDLKEYFEEDGRFYLVFPRMLGGSLFETIVNRGRITEGEAANVVRQISSGLAYLHSKGIAHRDIKPENILCARSGLIDPVLICDFDLGSPVKLVREGRSTTPALLTPVGSAEFMAPEVVDAWLTDQATGYDKKCDLWSLGVITYVLLCGYPPFNGECGSECGWRDLGRYCHDCQMDLFTRIQSCSIEFPESEWNLVSETAKDFVRCLLVRDARIRPSAVEIMHHIWLMSPNTASPSDEKEKTGATLLATPSALKKSNALSVLIERSNDAYRRASMADQLGDSLLSYPPFPPAKFCLGSDDEDVGDDEVDADEVQKEKDRMDEQLLATTPRVGTGNLMALCISEISTNANWLPPHEMCESEAGFLTISDNFSTNDADFTVGNLDYPAPISAPDNQTPP